MFWYQWSTAHDIAANVINSFVHKYVHCCTQLYVYTIIFFIYTYGDILYQLVSYENNLIYVWYSIFLDNWNSLPKEVYQYFTFHKPAVFINIPIC